MPEASKGTIVSKSSILAQGVTLPAMFAAGGPQMEMEGIFDLLASDMGPFMVVGIYLAFRGCFKPSLVWLDRITHIEAAAFLLYGFFFVAMSSTPFLYWIWFIMMFTGAAKTLVFVWMSNPWFKIADAPMRACITLKRHM